MRKLIDTDEEFRGAICCLAHDVAPRRDDRSEGISLVIENAGLHHESLSAPDGGDRNPAGCKRAPYVDSGKRPIDVLWRKEEVGAGEQ